MGRARFLEKKAFRNLFKISTLGNVGAERCHIAGGPAPHPGHKATSDSFA